MQYGPRFRALLVYLRDYQLLPYERLTQLCRDLLGAGVCKRTVETAGMQVYRACAVRETVRARMLSEAVLHADETGMRVDGKLQWIHSLSAPELTLYQAHPKRGGKAIEANGVIPEFKGVLVHDCWGALFPIRRHARAVGRIFCANCWEYAKTRDTAGRASCPSSWG